MKMQGGSSLVNRHGPYFVAQIIASPILLPVGQIFQN